MAFPPMYAQQPQGTLVPGQMISVNKYNVQVERYLSQGGFAHVYLVRTAEPLFGTTHHVLKRIAVANEAMLNDVKKEVDIMRILRGHPNIVYLIDAAWHRMPTGMFEVFILMEFCSGGGIIDMMNRRLRERLTEAEILQIFVDVCEGVAAMHNLRPPLLHRDLKVENILQASATSFKLCDFGSAMPVAPRPPSSTQEIRALEADLNKHTTLQYRAPEMVDVFLRRPIDEKSDVWALGVLLYKLCYYTTPFEEHGVLAILNVQYKFPPYPVYSQQLNALIASMLREHNAHRPSAFEVLDTVHVMRGTKSRFTYNPPQKPLSPGQALSPVSSRRTSTALSNAPEPGSTPPGNGIQAREKVLEAIAPMRRGRPSSPTRGRRAPDDALNLIDSVEDGPWASRPAKAHKSGLAAISTAKSPPPVSRVISGLSDAWQVPGAKNDKRQSTGTTNGFADSFDAHAQAAVSVSAPRPVPVHANSSLRPPGDAFESLNFFPSPKLQTLTLGEAQKATSTRPSPSPQASNQKYSISPSPSFKSPSPLPTGNSMTRKDASPLFASKPSDQAFAAEQRFPSIEELDAGTFGPVPTAGSVSVPATAPAPSPAPPQLPPRPTQRDSSASFYPASVAGALQSPSGAKDGLAIGLRNDGVRSQQVTGTAMRDARRTRVPLVDQSTTVSSADRSKQGSFDVRQSRIEGGSREKLRSPSRPVLVRKHRSSISIKHNQRTGSDASPTKPISGLPVSTNAPKDWLTGTSDVEDSVHFGGSARLRASPEKRASVLESPGLPDVGRAASFRETVPSPVKRKPVPVDRVKSVEPERGVSEIDKKKENSQPAGLTESWSPVSPRSSSSDDGDEGPEDAIGTIHPSKVPLKSSTQQRIGHKGRQGSVHDLVDLWGGSGSPKVSPSKQDKRSSMLVAPLGTGPTADRRKSPSPVPPVSTLASASPIPEKRSPSKATVSLSRNPSLASRNTPSGHVRKPTSPSKAQQASPAPSTSRSRPQSMLLFPVQKSVSEMGPQTPAKTALTKPANKGRSTHRRSSISDLVSKYEAIEVQSKTAAVVPAPAIKPARLRSANPPSLGSLEPTESPTAASTRFPRISPSTSPKTTDFSAGLEPPRRSSPAKSDPQRRDPSPCPVSRAVTPARQNSSNIDKETSGLPTMTTEFPRFERKPISAPSIATKELSTPASTNASQEEERGPPSPERPYQGVGKLIDQWQKKSEGMNPGRNGGGGSPGLKGAGSRLRREGIVAGGKLA